MTCYKSGLTHIQHTPTVHRNQPLSIAPLPSSELRVIPGERLFFSASHWALTLVQCGLSVPCILPLEFATMPATATLPTNRRTRCAQCNRTMVSEYAYLPGVADLCSSECYWPWHRRTNRCGIDCHEVH